MRRVLILALTLSLAVSACGRKGDLQPPPGPSSAQEKPAKTRSFF